MTCYDVPERRDENHERAGAKCIEAVAVRESLQHLFSPDACGQDPSVDVRAFARHTYPPVWFNVDPQLAPDGPDGCSIAGLLPPK